MPALSANLFAPYIVPDRNFLSLSGVGEGSGDVYVEANTAALATVAASGQVYYIPTGSTLAFGEGAAFASGSGLVCKKGYATLLMKTATPTGVQQRFSASTTGLGLQYDVARNLITNVAEASDIVLDGLDIEMETNAAARTSQAIALFQANNPQIGRLRFRNFLEPTEGIVSFRTIKGGGYDLMEFYDCYNDRGLLAYQLSALSVDDNVGPTEAAVTEGLRCGRLYTSNFQFGATQRLMAGEQTDAVAISSYPWWSGNVFEEIICDNGAPAEILDLHGTGNTFKLVKWKDALGMALKIIYNARDNVINAQGDGTGLAAVFLKSYASSNPRTGEVARNLINLNVKNIGNSYLSVWSPGQTMHSAIQMESESTGEPVRDNVITGRVHAISTPGAVVPHVAIAENCGQNVIDVHATGGYTGATFRHLAGTNPASAPQVFTNRARVPTKIMLYSSGSTTYRLAHQNRIPFALTSVRQPPTGRLVTGLSSTTVPAGLTSTNYTADVPQTVQFSGVIYISELTTGNWVEIQAQVGGHIFGIARMTNPTESSIAGPLPFNQSFRLAAGETIAFLLANSQGGDGPLLAQSGATTPHSVRLDIIETGTDYPFE